MSQRRPDNGRAVRAFPRFLRLFWRLFWDRRTSWKARLVLLATLLYVVSPIDLIPDFIFPVVGFVDDLTVLIFGCQAFLRFIPLPVVEEHLTALDVQGPAPQP